MAKEAAPRTGLAVGINKGHVRSIPDYPQGRQAVNGVGRQDDSDNDDNGRWTMQGRDGRVENFLKRKTTPRVVKPRVSRTKGHLSKRTAFVRDIVKEVAGLAPYERRVIELLRNSKDKRARKLAKKRLGTFGRAKRKVDELTRVIAESRRH
ncbi:large subunit ribosomal protein L36e [Sporothrix brasiliensis 5110]|uniref:60S ribosomal protein L36 n=1 Tax=Sporothrix brasiliensis 5110 TaxID=1398154 RepID=A0A0C2EQ78_9PEZI|nr:large subunit ribosomal protein L36e [Sporothrix brasiliensis 5110]KIH88489.1 large subunit ribosomal protein L36e [Sporothrix brasiliensis 5110]